jgi:hypothetical protein
MENQPKIIKRIKNENQLIIKIPRSGPAPLLNDEKTGKIYPVDRVPGGLRMGKPIKNTK